MNKSEKFSSHPSLYRQVDHQLAMIGNPLCNATFLSP